MKMRPSLPGTLLAAVLVALFLSLGAWQSKRAAIKESRIEAFESAGHALSLPDPSQASPGLNVTLVGRFDARRHTLADNQVFRGRAGVHVYTPFKTGKQAVLVNRGWLPLGNDRSQLPVIPPMPEEQVEISGRVSEVPGVGRRLGEAIEMDGDRWPQLVTYPELDRIETALDTELYPYILLLDAASPGGFGDRDWKPVFLSPDKHRAYAFQWFAMAATALAGWILLALRRGESRDGGAR